MVVRPDITDRLPQYQLVRKLAGTSASEVFLALDTGSGERVALKVVGPGLREQHDRHERFARESEIALRMSHPHIVPVHAAGESVDGELGYLAMRYVDGPNLLRLIGAEGRLGLDSTIGLVRQVADALDAAHVDGVVHRDVKPGNILVEDGHAYLSDFGIARHTALATVTASNGFVGTLSYSAPEQVEGGEVDRRADVYALGCVVHHCLMGYPPPSGGSDERGLRTVQRQVLRPFVDAPVSRALLKAMARRPEDRYDSCADFVDALTAAATIRSRRRRTTVVLGALALVSTLVAGSVLLDRGPSVDLTHVPVALREDCSADTPQPGSVGTVSCRAVISSLFADAAAVGTAFTAALTRAGTSLPEGDCYAGTAGAHRYPATGPARGSVLCHLDGQTAVVVWTDDDARTVNRAQGADLAGLTRSWASWTGSAPPAFPTDDERALLEVAAGTECVRDRLDLVTRAVAGVRCQPAGIGAREVSYYRYATVDALREDIAGRAEAVSAPKSTPCVGASGFPATGRHSWRGIDLGQAVCHSTGNGRHAVEWSTEPLAVMGRATGDLPEAVAGWWGQWRVAPLSRIVEQVNARSTPAFPTDAERELTGHIPKISRVACTRADPDQKWRDVGAVPATAVVCGPTGGAELVAYYRFAGAEDLKSAFLPRPDHHVATATGSRLESCLVDVAEFTAESGYSRGGAQGRLRCVQDENTGERSMQWTDDQRLIMVSARRGAAPPAMVDWWTHDAGPI
ncbi:serine/threonine-protein kinase [Saccharothrix xinjiangensis]|uniref:non-specific serine/threonine protein kinase n=1 Tax=Saccharothrix xinjiangensis TaxID=204798 RepID=A0ABV9YBZ4_9PSEU